MTGTIPPASITSELERIWDSLQGTNKMRACLFNMIIYTSKGEREEYLRSVAQKIIQKFPSRIIFITMDPDTTHEDLKTSVSVMTADEGENAIACDLINIEASGRHQERVPFVVLPQLLPDLPIYLVYGNNACVGDPIAEKLEAFATRIIFDSEATDDITCFAKNLAGYCSRKQSDIADLNWARVEGWRDLLAETFHSPDRLAQLQDTDCIHIHYQDETNEAIKRPEIEALYLQGWLANQLGWEYTDLEKKEGNTIIHYEHRRVYLNPSRMSELTPGRIISVEIMTASEETFLLRRCLECINHVSIEISTNQTCSLPSQYIFDKDETGQSLVQEICHRGTSQHFINLLNLLCRLPL